jgi:hypothetical protein
VIRRDRKQVKTDSGNTGRFNFTRSQTCE